MYVQDFLIHHESDRLDDYDDNAEHLKWTFYFFCLPDVALLYILHHQSADQDATLLTTMRSMN
jgi:hypothetical protein